MCGGGGDEGLAGAHLADDGGAPVGFEGEGRSLDGVLLRPQGLAEQAGELVAVLRGPVEGWVGLHHPLGDGVLERVDDLKRPDIGPLLSLSIGAIYFVLRHTVLPSLPMRAVWVMLAAPSQRAGGCPSSARRPVLKKTEAILGRSH